MKVLDPGHKYELAVLDGDLPVILTYAKRIGDKYPGNEPPSYSGTTLQEEWRAQIDRLRYLNNQESHWVNTESAKHLMDCLVLLESRAAERHGRVSPSIVDVLSGAVCPKCLHAGCGGSCH